MDKEYLLKKWLGNNLTEAELVAFKAMDNAKLYEEISDEAQRFSGQNQAKVASFSALEKQLLKKKTPTFNWISAISKFAAIFIFGLVLFLFWNNEATTTITTNLAQSETITLPDSSIIKLNEFSEVSYNLSNWNTNRTLNLKGEAFFKVANGNRFDVKTHLGMVSVLGTEFNILSRDSILKVTCYKGLIQVHYGDEFIKLPTGSEFKLDAGKAKKTEIAIVKPLWLD